MSKPAAFDELDSRFSFDADNGLTLKIVASVPTAVLAMPRCCKCPQLAWFNFGGGHLLCAECANKMLERCRISASPPASGEEACGGATNRKGAVPLNTGSAPTDTRAPLNPSAGVASGPQDSISPIIPGECAAALTLASGPTDGEAAATIPDPSDCRDSPDGPAATTPSAPEGAAGNSFGKQCIARLRRNATTLRVTAENSIQGSSHI